MDFEARGFRGTQIIVARGFRGTQIIVAGDALSLRWFRPRMLSFVLDLQRIIPFVGCAQHERTLAIARSRYQTVRLVAMS